MSTEQQVDPQLVEETKQQIRDLVNEIAQLARSDVAPQEFYGQFLDRVVTALAAEGGAIWTTGDGNRIELTYQINFVNTGLADSQEDQARHGKLLGKVLTSGESMIVAPHSGATDDDEGANPTGFLLILGPLMADQDVKGVVEVFQRPGARSTTQRGYMRFLDQMCDLAGDYLKTRSLRSFTDRQSLWNQLETFTREVHKGLDPRETAYTIANEGRRLIQCDRVSVAIRYGRKCRIEAVSGQDTFDKRSNTVRLLGRLATAVTATGESVWFTGDTSNMAPQVEDAVQEYIDEAHSKTVGILPLVRPKSADAENPHEEDPPEVIGALIVEQIEDAKLREGTLQRVDVVRDHSASALSNAQEHNNLFLMPVWRTIGKATWIIKARTLPKTLAICGLILAAIAALIVVPYDFDMQGRGELQPEVKFDVFAPSDGGVVVKTYKEHGDPVTAGEALLLLKNRELESRKIDVLKESETTQAALDRARRELNQAKRQDEREKLYGEILQYQKSLESYVRQLALIEEKEKQLTVASPIPGEVLTWDVHKTLGHRTVQPGQILVTVANPKEQWELKVHMPEDKIGPVKEAQKRFDEQRAALLEKTSTGSADERDQAQAALDELGPGLKVEYVLASEPENTHAGYVREIYHRADMQGDKGNAVTIRVAINKEDITELLPGASVTARIHCGKQSIGYVWFRDLSNFLHREVFFRF